MTCKVADIAKIMECIAPLNLAEQWDNVGLLLGDEDATVKRIMVCLDITRTLAEEAVSKNVDMIITHHPVIFDPIKSIKRNSRLGELLYLFIAKGISVYCAHTNLDKAEHGTDYALANTLGLLDSKPLCVSSNLDKLLKIAVFVPENHERQVFEAMAEAGAGHIGKYSNCSFRTSGIGTFLPLEGTNPYIGCKDVLESVKEIRLEMVLPESKLDSIVSRMIKEHPYEEVAYDVYSLSNRTNENGFGRIGMLSQKTSLYDYAKHIRKALNTSNVSIIGDLKRDIQCVAVCAGSGADLIDKAKSSGADLFVTGEIKYHHALECAGMGMAAISAGHYTTEQPVLCELIERLQIQASNLQYDVDILLPDTVTDPYQTLN